MRLVINLNHLNSMSDNRKLPALFLLTSLLTGMLLVISCIKDPTLPAITTDEAREITINSAIVDGNVTEDGGAEVTVRGICWGTGSMPTLDDSFKASGTGPGEFSCTIEGLDPNTEYYARAFAENSIGIAFGNEIAFKTGIAPPSVTTGQVSEIMANSAVCSGIIVYDGGAGITEKGICWSLTPEPDVQGSHTSIATGSVTYTCTLSGLTAGTRYYARAYVKNQGGILAYGEQIVFNTKLADIEGNLYSVVYIGNQVWMVENLRTTKFNNNAPIPNITDNTEWLNLTGAAYCWYNNDIQYKSTFGALYSWYTITDGDLCPTGWHVPSDDEYGTLEVYLGLNPDSVKVWGWRGTNQGIQIKSTTGWEDGGNGTNTSGFTGLPGGFRYAAQGAFYSLGKLTYWWSSSELNANEGWYRLIDNTNNDIYRATTSKKGGKYIRCVKN